MVYAQAPGFAGGRFLVYNINLIIENIVNIIDNRTYVCYCNYIATLVRVVTGDEPMDYKALIIELLDKAEERHLKIIFCYIKALLGLG